MLLLLIFSGSSNSQQCVSDDLGERICLEHQARRILSISPHATELVFDAGAGHKIIGTVRFSDYPEQAKQVKRVGDASGLDREALLLLQPDLVIAWPSGNKPADLAWLKNIGLPVFHSEPKRLEQIAEAIRSIGQLAGTQMAANAKADLFLAEIQELCPLKEGNRTYIHIWDQPRMTMGGDHWINAVLKTAGLTNIFSDVDDDTIIISDEAWLSRRADIQLKTPHAVTDQSPAGVQIVSSDFSRPTTRLAETIKLLCALK